jgi:hypothetical protein
VMHFFLRQSGFSLKYLLPTFLFYQAACQIVRFSVWIRQKIAASGMGQAQ